MPRASLRLREAALLAANALGALLPLPELAALAALLLAAHLRLWRATRWQLAPSHVAQALTAAVAAGALQPAAWLQALSLVLVVGSLVLALALPMRAIVPPSGPWRVGVKHFHLVRPAAAAGDGGLLEFNVRVFFPAPPDAPVAARPYLALGRDTALGYARFIKMPALIFSHLPLLTVEDAVVAHVASQGRALPLVVFSHGLGGTPDCYQSLLLDWASHGMLVLAVEHNDFSQAVTRLPGDRLRFYKPLAEMRMLAPGGEQPAARPRSDFEVRNAQLLHRVAEARAALDAALQDSRGDDVFPLGGLLRGLVDERRVAAAGHSFGGATAVAWAFDDARVHACVNLDGWQLPLPPQVVERGLAATPLLLIESEAFRHMPENYDSMLKMHRASRHSRFFTLRGSGHQNFSDFPVLSPMATRAIKAAGRLDPDRAIRIINRYTRAFFRGALEWPARQGSDDDDDPQALQPEALAAQRDLLEEKK
jgi:dienelactone hydrolase